MRTIIHDELGSYQTPLLEVVEATIEQGFAATADLDYDTNPDYDEFA